MTILFKKLWLAGVEQWFELWSTDLEAMGLNSVGSWFFLLLTFSILIRTQVVSSIRKVGVDANKMEFKLCCQMQIIS